uniref:FG-GAP repeat protein n=1 Tax=Candidatus Electronema sp. TaxID=2698783 RepID=UPI0040568467
MRRLNRLRSVAERLAASPDKAANDPAELRKLLAEDGDKFKLFGYAVSLSADGRTVLIGDAGGFGGDSVGYVFIKEADGSYSQQTKLIGPFSSPMPKNMSLSADGCTIIASDLGSDAVYLFTMGEDGIWSQKVKLADYSNIAFGSPVSLSADGRVVLFTYTFGAAHVVVKHEDGTWSQEAELRLPDPIRNVLFGWSVSLSADGKIALVGAPYYDSDPDDVFKYFGAVYVFGKGEDGSWSQQAKLTSEDKAEWFGSAVSLSADGRTVLIKSPGDTGDNNTVYVFVKGEDGSWSQQAKLTAGAGEAYEGFGSALSLSADGRIALIGARRDDDRANDSGAAYVFVKNDDGTWHQRFKLTAEDGEAGDGFGASVSLSADGQTALIGAPWDDDRGTNSGSAYVFSIPPANASAPVSMMRLRR